MSIKIQGNTQWDYNSRIYVLITLVTNSIVTKVRIFAKSKQNPSKLTSLRVNDQSNNRPIQLGSVGVKSRSNQCPTLYVTNEG